MTRLCAAAGIRDQRCLVGPDATVDRVRAALTEAVRDIDPNGLLALTFTGHSDRRSQDERGQRIVQWCLYDGELRLDEVAGLLGPLAETVRVVVVADTCYAGAIAHYLGLACTVVLLGACADNQTTISGPSSEFVVRLEDLTYPRGVRNPECASYGWLQERLQDNAPDAEMPQVWTNNPAARTQRPFDLDQCQEEKQ